MGKYLLSRHALEQLGLRGIKEESVWKVIDNPDQIIKRANDEDIYQSIIYDESNRKYLLRIFINTNKNPRLIITVYKTSKIDKYWDNES